MQVIVLAGGKGKRLWPLSSEACPKQFLDFETGESLLMQTVKRFAQDEVLVVTSQKYAEIAQKQLGPSFGDAILVEPESRNTAPAICLGLKYFLEKMGGSEDEVCVVCPSDHHFGLEEDFLLQLPLAKTVAQKGKIVTFGVKPTYPDTGYGYIQTCQGEDVLPVTQFIEKPSLEKAQKLLERGDYYWNMGVFVFQIGTFLKQLCLHAPLFTEWFKQPYEKALCSFSTLPALSIDHVLMEKTDQIALIHYPSSWSDLGTWERLSAVLPKDEHGNFLSGEIEALQTQGCMVFGEGIVTVGVEDLLIVKIEGKVVVCKKEAMHRLKEVQRMQTLTQKIDSC